MITSAVNISQAEKCNFLSHCSYFFLHKLAPQNTMVISPCRKILLDYVITSAVNILQAQKCNFFVIHSFAALQN